MQEFSSVILTPIIALATLMQVWNNSSYCSDTVIFTCVNEQRRFLIWDVYDDDILIIAITLTSSQSTKRSTRRFENSAIIAEITYRNSTALASILTITNFSALSANAVACNDIRNVIIPHDAFPSKQMLVITFSKVILCHHILSLFT